MKVTDKSWLTSREGNVKKRWSDFLDKKKAALGSTTASPDPVQSQSMEEDMREGPGASADAEEDIRDQPEELEKRSRSGVSDSEVEEESRSRQEEMIEKQRIDPDEDFKNEATEMFPLFENRNWTALCSYIQSHPRCTTLLLTCGSEGLAISTKGNLLLHEACRIDPPAEVIDALLAANKDAAKVKGEKGYLPLHYACACASVEVVQKLVEAYPEAAKIRNESDLMLPLHIACKWGFSKGALGALLSAYSEGAKVRDIYAMVPMDYATKLSDDEIREEAIACLQRDTKNAPGRVGLVEQSGMSFGEVREDLNTANIKLERMTAELDQRERSFALLFGREQEKVRNLEEEREQLLIVSKEAKASLEVRTHKLEVLEKEQTMLKALQKSNAQKRALLQKKVEILESAHGVKKDIIGRLEHKINVKCKQEMDYALKFQETEFKELLGEEKKRSEELQKQLEDAKLNHQHYTKALLQEHENEITKFEDITRKYEILERELREKIEYESVMRDSVEVELCEKEAKYKADLKREQEKVVYLENHVKSVNELLESEQQRFAALDILLNEAIQKEDVEHKELVTSMESRKSEYENLLNDEREQVKKLAIAYDIAQTKLLEEAERIEKLEKEQETLAEKFRVEQETVIALEAAKSKFETLLEAERRIVADLESNKCEKVQSLVESYEKQIAVLREEISQDEKKEQFNEISNERDELKKLLEQEQIKVEKLSEQQAALNGLLEAEKERVTNLEHAAKIMTHMSASGKQRNLSECPSEEERDAELAETQKQLTFERTRIWNLHTEQSAMQTIQKKLQKRVTFLETELEQKQALLLSEQSKFDVLELEHGKTLELLQSEREILMTIRQEYEVNKGILEEGKQNLLSLTKSVEEAENFVASDNASSSEELEVTVAAYERAMGLKKVKADLDAAKEYIGKLEAAQHEKTQRLSEEQEKISQVEQSLQEQQVASAAEQEKIQQLKKDVKSQELRLDFEKERVQELEMEISRITSLLMSEKKKVTDLTDDNNRMSTELKDIKLKATSLEQEHGKNKELLANEMDKVKGLERAHEQLQELLQWERSNGHSAGKLAELLEKLKDVEAELSSAMTDLDEKEVKVQKLTEQLEYFEWMKTEVVRLSAESRKRDLMLGSLLQAVDGDATSSNDPSVQNAKMYMKDMKRIIGPGLAGNVHLTL